MTEGEEWSFPYELGGGRLAARLGCMEEGLWSGTTGVRELWSGTA